MPRARPVVGGVIGAIRFGLDQQRDLRSQIFGKGRRARLIVHHADRAALGGQPEHGVDKVAAAARSNVVGFAARAGQAVESAGADDVVLGPGRAQQQLAGQLARPVGAQRVGRVGLYVGRAFGPVEDVVGADVEQRRADLAADQRHAMDGQRVHRQRLRCVSLDVIHAVIGRAVDHQAGNKTEYSRAQISLVAYVQRDRRGPVRFELDVLQAGCAARGAQHMVMRKGGQQVAAKLAARADEQNLHRQRIIADRPAGSSLGCVHQERQPPAHC